MASRSVVVPVRTVSESNQREHWATKARRVRRQRRDVGYFLVAFVQKPWFPCTVRLVRVAPRALDDDNLRGALKAVRDAVAAWLGVDDRDERVTWAYGERRGKTREHAVVIEIEE